MDALVYFPVYYYNGIPSSTMYHSERIDPIIRKP